MAKTSEAKLEYMRLDQLPPWPRNPKKHDIPTLQKSLMRFGWVLPVILDEDSKRLLAGHGRCETALSLKAMSEKDRVEKFGAAMPDRVRLAKDGEWMIPVLRGVQFKSAKEAEAYLLADNRTNELGGWDDEMLTEMLRDLQASGDTADLAGVGWDDGEINALIRATNSDRDKGLAPEEKLGGYIDAAIKQLTLFFDSDQYDSTVARLQRVMEHAQAETHTDAVLKMLLEYEEKHALPPLPSADQLELPSGEAEPS